MKSAIYTLVAATACGSAGRSPSTADAAPPATTGAATLTAPRATTAATITGQGTTRTGTMPRIEPITGRTIASPIMAAITGAVYGGYYAPGVNIGVGPVGIQAF